MNTDKKNRTRRINVDIEILDSVSGSSPEEARACFNAHDMPDQEIVEEAIVILRDEANELACLQTAPVWKELPHRAKIAIRREMDRLRAIAEAMKP
jgi:hypothetical protein